MTEAEASWGREQSYHIREQENYFSSPFVLTQQSLEQLRRQHPMMDKEDAHRFCWKNCAVYITIDLGGQHGSTGVGVERIFNFLYRRWIRDGEEHLDVGNFFGRGVRSWDEADAYDGSSESERYQDSGFYGTGLKTVKEIVEAHRLICERVREKMADADADRDEVYTWRKRHADYVMKKSFDRFLVIVDQHVWWERGVLLVRSERLKKEIEEGKEGDIKEWPAFSEGDEGWAVKMGMEEVVKLVREMEDNDNDNDKN